MIYYYTRKGPNGLLEEQAATVTHEELLELVRPHLVPEGFEVIDWESGPEGWDIRYRRAQSEEGTQK